MDLSNLRTSENDNAKHGATRTKADASMPAFWPTSMGAWDAPGRVIVPAEREPDGDGDDSYESEQGVGTQSYDPISMYKPSDFNPRKA